MSVELAGMKLPFSKVIKFARSKPLEMDRAAEEFFAGGMVEFDNEEVDTLFSEWLIYDFKQNNGLSFFAEYCLNNPDNLSEDLIQKLTDALETAKYSLFQIGKIKRGEWIELEDLYSGNIYLVWDEMGSSQFDRGQFMPGLQKLMRNTLW